MIHNKPDVKYAFLKSLPVMFGYLFLGTAFGIVLTDAGYNAWWALMMSSVVFAGSMQFVMIPMMVSAVSPLTMALTTLFVNSRHLFYGLSFIESYKKMKTRPYMIFSLTDETYSVLCGCRTEDPEEEKRSSWFLISLFNQSYWIIGSVFGALLGEIIPFDMTGIDFSMTALFVVILVEQILSDPSKTWFTSLTGGLMALICLLIFGSGNFLLPALLITVFIVGIYGTVRKSNRAVLKKHDENKADKEENK